MAPLMNRKICLAARPRGLPVVSDFALVEAPVGEIGDGEFLVHNLYLGLAPASRIRMGESRAYAEPTPIGDVVYGQSVGRVIASRHPGFQVGEAVHIDSGWQEYTISRGPGTFKIDAAAAPLTAHLSVLGSSGLTAYAGMMDVAHPKAGETVVISAASGAVGSVVGQIAKILGCRAVGIAGGPDKCRYVVEELGFDACVDHRAPDFPAKLAAACPKGIDVDFENVGGAVRDAVWTLLNDHARVAICGLISEYNEAAPAPGPNWMAALTRRITIQGFLLRDRLAHRDAYLAALTAWLQQGKIRYREDVTVGLENAPAAFIGLLQGRNFGKAIVKIADA